jgi:hypothetical protein
MGNNFGGPFNADQQTAILRRAFCLFEEVDEGGFLEDWSDAWPTQVEYFRGRTGASG